MWMIIFSLVFQSDGIVSVKADCNQGSGTYTLSGNQISIGPISITAAYCGDDSLDGVFLESLESVTVATLENGRLVLSTEDGSLRMVFNAAVVEVPSTLRLPISGILTCTP